MVILRSSVALSLSAVCLTLVACSSEDSPSDPDTGGTATGGVGASSTGGLGATSATGGVLGGTGGVAGGTGGMPTGGIAGNTGGLPTGGVAGNTGGMPTGGILDNTGGIVQNTGGTPTGGADPVGGATTGGAPPTGGAGTGGTDDPKANFHIYLALGQSNMQGAAFLPDEPVFHERVQVLQGMNCPASDGNPYSYGEWREMFPPMIKCKEGERSYPGISGPIGLGPADSFAVTMAEAAPENVTIGIVGAAYGGTSIEMHLPGCTGQCLPADWGTNVNGAPETNGVTLLYDWAVDLGRRAQEVGTIKGIIFHQGENNSGEADWPSKVNTYVTALRNDLNLDPAEVPFIAGELPYTGCCASAHNPRVHEIPDHVENGHWVSAGPMPDGTVLGDRGDSLHWSTFSVIEMGKRYAAKMLEVGN